MFDKVRFRAPPFSAVVLLALWLTATPALAADPPRVMVSIKPVHSLVAWVMKGIAEPDLIVTGDHSPLDYQLTTEQASAMRAADLVIWTGPELEPFLAPSVAKLDESIRVVELLASDELKVLPARGGDGRRDPFFWLDSRNALILLDELTRALIGLDPARAARYRENHSRAVAAIAAIDRELEYRYRDVSAAPVALYHDTQQYFEQAYAASVAVIVSPQPGKSPDTAALLAARARVQTGAVSCLFTETAFESPSLDLVTSGGGITVVALDSLGALLQPGVELYPQLMRNHFTAIRDCIAPNGAIAEIRPRGHRDLAAESPAPGQLSGRFILTDQHGRAVSNLDFIGKFQLIAFGFTSCPDVCPTALSLMTSAMQRLGKRSDRIQPIFITVDPERDTPAVLAKYTDFFHPRLLGLSGNSDMIDHTAHDFGVRYEKVPIGNGDYTMNHTAGFFLFGPDGTFLEKLAHGLNAEQLANKLDRYLR